MKIRIREQRECVPIKELKGVQKEIEDLLKKK